MTSMTELIKYIKEKVNIDHDLENQIKSSFELVHAKKGDYLLREGNRAKFLFFINKGILHNYYHHSDGRKISSWFYDEFQFITSWSSFYRQKVSFESIECLEDCELFRISYADYQRLIHTYQSFSQFARLLSEELLVAIDEFSKNWAYLTADEKYKLLLYYCPQIELRVKLGLISSFLGISQETLSRLRAKR